MLKRLPNTPLLSGVIFTPYKVSVTYLGLALLLTTAETELHVCEKVYTKLFYQPKALSTR